MTASARAGLISRCYSPRPSRMPRSPRPEAPWAGAPPPPPPRPHLRPSPHPPPLPPRRGRGCPRRGLRRNSRRRRPTYRSAQWRLPRVYGRRPRGRVAVLGLSSFGVHQRRCPVSLRAALHPAEDDRHQTPGPAVFLSS
uniref:Uncharacterized protein n=1 Tax=Arundo donax TaxID=35708 RepID=A0A0A8Y2C3_ARUDO